MLNKKLLRIGLPIFYIPKFKYGIISSWDDDFVFVIFNGYSDPVAADISQLQFTGNETLKTSNFWEAVKSEFKSDESPYLCDSSKSFKTGWIRYDRELITLFQEFCKVKGYTLKSTTFSLIDQDLPTTKVIEIKNEFINWCINKYKSV